MKIYLVGGAVRDSLLKIPVKERDWVVVGATPQEMFNLGFTSVGKDFPVFLHPKTKDEYALARTERKISPGYTGFSFNTTPTISLEEDLLRRDLTINAIAQDSDGHLIDPYHGIDDLKKKILRHVSPAFTEDPVRILRLARFSARFPDFIIASETLALMKTMVENGEVNSLVPERVWQELYKALSEKEPLKFFDSLDACGAIDIIFPSLFYKKNSCLKKAIEQSHDLQIRFAIIFFNAENIKSLCEKIKAPKDFYELATLTQKNNVLFKKALTGDARDTMNLFEAVDSFRRPERFQQFLIACQAIENISSISRIENHFSIAQKISIKDVDPTLKGQDIAKAIHQIRIETLNKKDFS